MPALGPMKPLTYNGCKIYAMANGRRWRVYPHPQLSVYDKKFSWGKTPSKSWAPLLDYCEHPTLPASRSGDIAHCRWSQAGQRSISLAGRRLKYRLSTIASWAYDFCGFRWG